MPTLYVMVTGKQLIWEENIKNNSRQIASKPFLRRNEMFCLSVDVHCLIAGQRIGKSDQAQAHTRAHKLMTCRGCMYTINMFDQS